jgi:hypothetical protein
MLNTDPPYQQNNVANLSKLAPVTCVYGVYQEGLTCTRVCMYACMTLLPCIHACLLTREGNIDTTYITDSSFVRLMKPYSSHRGMDGGREIKPIS